MSVIIKNREMPEGCVECWNRFSCKHFEISFIRLNTRHPDCPLIEVPAPHGRLIDADALDKRVRQAGGTADAEVNCTEDFNDGILFVLDYFVKSMQTVIEAEVSK